MGKSKCHENQVRRSIATFLFKAFQDCSYTK